jgi:hypothetical protein
MRSGNRCFKIFAVWHRSVYSWQVRTSLDLAIRNSHWSVTLLPYGCSGAEIFSGLLYAYSGVEYDHSEDRGVLGARSELGLAYQELCPPRDYASIKVPHVEPNTQNDSALNAAVGRLTVDQWKIQLPAQFAEKTRKFGLRAGFRPANLHRQIFSSELRRKSDAGRTVRFCAARACSPREDRANEAVHLLMSSQVKRRLAKTARSECAPRCRSSSAPTGLPSAALAVVLIAISDGSGT